LSNELAAKTNAGTLKIKSFDKLMQETFKVMFD
jgi:hypothetical protein